MTPIPGPMRPRADETVLRSISQRVLWLSCAIVDAKSMPKRFASSVNARASSWRAAGSPGRWNTVRWENAPPSAAVECWSSARVVTPARVRKLLTAATIPGWSRHRMRSRPR